MLPCVNQMDGNRLKSTATRYMGMGVLVCKPFPCSCCKNESIISLNINTSDEV